MDTSSTSWSNSTNTKQSITIIRKIRPRCVNSRMGEQRTEGLSSLGSTAEAIFSAIMRLKSIRRTRWPWRSKLASTCPPTNRYTMCQTTTFHRSTTSSRSLSSSGLRTSKKTKTSSMSNQRLWSRTLSSTYLSLMEVKEAKRSRCRMSSSSSRCSSSYNYRNSSNSNLILSSSSRSTEVTCYSRTSPI